MNFAPALVLKSTVLLSCAGLVAWSLRRASASVRHAVWLIALVCVLMLPLVSLVLPAIELPLLPSNEETIVTAE